MSELNEGQTAAVTAVKRGRNIFLTGAGGTGKSHTIRAIVSWAAHAGIRVAVTAMTGCAALLLNSIGSRVKAKTLHSWAGVGLAREAPHELAEAVAKNKRAARRWIDTQLLIVDEVSMMTPEFLEKLDLISRRVRKRADAKFGGLQLVFAGDFCQLPPVNKGDAEAAYVFESPVWTSLMEENHNLTQIVRQSDPVFQRLLTEARMGTLSAESLAVLESRKGLDWSDNEIKPTLLFTRNAEVSTINKKNMEALDGERRTYEVKTVEMDPTDKSMKGRIITREDPDVQPLLARLDLDAPYDPTLELCVGAQVMLLTNMDQEHGLVNGSRGVVTGYSPGGLPLVRFVGFTDPVIIDRANWWLAEPDYIGRSQIPLKVAYALTIHKSQGATLDSALIDIGSSTFEFGQAYVALSRVRSLEGLYVWALNPKRIMCHPSVVAFYKSLEKADEEKLSEEGIKTPEKAETPEPETPEIKYGVNTLTPKWQTIVEPRIHRIASAIDALGLNDEQISPPSADVFAALRACPDPSNIRVVILGQDPYPTIGNAHGLAFSIRPTNAKIPPSLQNIFKELTSDLGCSMQTSGNLQGWADQGVLLLNDLLTVTVGKPLSHSGIGWEEMTTSLLATVLTAAPHVVVIAWGRPAQKKLSHKMIAPLLSKHTVIEAPHPSPLSAHTGFFGSKPFSKANAALASKGQTEIRWT